jgi:CDP-6-deoxy-D-xylo-4-hexulose-3-dehydrase
MKYKYPLQSYPWSLLDRIKVASFVLDYRNRLTMGEMVKEFENQFESFCNHEVKCVATSSGSTANSLMLEMFLQANDIEVKDVTFFCNSTTWTSNVTPLIMRGCNVEFIDINLYDFSMDYKVLEEKLKKNKSQYKVIWLTCLIGFSPNVYRLNQLAKKYNTYLFADVCEAAGTYLDDKPLLAHFDMATTSTYIAHLSSSIEGGMLFINNKFNIKIPYYYFAQLIRNHGLIRSLPVYSKIRCNAEVENPEIDPEFLFEVVGTNWRMSDLHAYMGILDFKRFPKYIKHRKKIWNYFISKLDSQYYWNSFTIEVTAFCLPVIVKDKKIDVGELKSKVNKAGWETRPIIAFLPEHKPFRKYAKEESFPNSEFLARRGFYCGLANNLKIKDVDKLLEVLNRPIK